MFKEGPRYKDSPVKPGGEGWLVNDQQQKVVRFKNDISTAHAEWVTLSTYSWMPPSTPVPMTQRRMLRHIHQVAVNAGKAISRQDARDKTSTKKDRDQISAADFKQWVYKLAELGYGTVTTTPRGAPLYEATRPMSA